MYESLIKDSDQGSTDDDLVSVEERDAYDEIEEDQEDAQETELDEEQIE